MVLSAFLALFSVFIFSFFLRRNRIFLPTRLIQSALKRKKNFINTMDRTLASINSVVNWWIGNRSNSESFADRI